MKICNSCGTNKKDAEFYKKLNALSSFCRLCTLKKAKEYRETPRAKTLIKKYIKSKSGVAARKKANKKWNTENREKMLTQKRTQDFVSRGRIKKLPCEKCGVKKVEAHHEDYSKPLDVVWYCKNHHMERHQEMRKNVQLPRWCRE